MKTLLKLVIAVFLLINQMSCHSSMRFGQWTVQNSTHDSSGLSWAKFTWTNEELGGKYFERTAMFIPVQIDGLPYPFLFQFDLGSNLTIIQGNTLKAILAKHPGFNRIKKQVALEDLILSFGDMKATTKNCYVMKDYGEGLSAEDLTDSIPIHLGSIGADMFQNKILIIDYPNQRFAVCDSLPLAMQPVFTGITLDKYGRAILPMTLNEKRFRIMFDNGSSLFPLITSGDKIDRFSTDPGTDTITISSWGTVHNVIGRPLKMPFQLAGKTFSDVMIYADYRKESSTSDCDAITGNALFWDKTVVIDFKNKRLGVK